MPYNMDNRNRTICRRYKTEKANRKHGRIFRKQMFISKKFGELKKTVLKLLDNGQSVDRRYFYQNYYKIIHNVVKINYLENKFEVIDYGKSIAPLMNSKINYKSTKFTKCNVNKHECENLLNIRKKLKNTLGFTPQKAYNVTEITDWQHKNFSISYILKSANCSKLFGFPCFKSCCDSSKESTSKHIHCLEHVEYSFPVTKIDLSEVPPTPISSISNWYSSSSSIVNLDDETLTVQANCKTVADLLRTQISNPLKKDAKNISIITQVKIFENKILNLLQTNDWNYVKRKLMLSKLPKTYNFWSKIIEQELSSVIQIESKYDLLRINGTNILNDTISKSKNLIQLSKIKPLCFKPGPLSKKKHLLIDSKIGNEWDYEIVPIPKLKIIATPEIGKELSPMAIKYINLSQSQSNVIDMNWAQFALSTLRTDNNNQQSNEYSFTIPFVNNEAQVLVKKEKQPEFNFDNTRNVDKDDIKALINDLIEYVERNEFFTEKLESLPHDPDNLLRNTDRTRNTDGTLVKKVDNYLNVIRRPKTNKQLSELKRLNVKIIEVATLDQFESNSSEDQSFQKICSSDSCKYGCLCNSLNYGYDSTRTEKSHCRKVDCMFKCNCGFTPTEEKRLKNMMLLPSGTDIMSNETMRILQKKVQQNLAKEEKKFSQAVIQSQDKTIILEDLQKKRVRKAALNCKKNFANGWISDMFKEKECIDKKKAKMDPVAINDFQSDFNLVMKHKMTYEKDKIMIYCMIHDLYDCPCNNNLNVQLRSENVIHSHSNINNNDSNSNSPIKLNKSDINTVSNRHNSIFGGASTSTFTLIPKKPSKNNIKNTNSKMYKEVVEITDIISDHDEDYLKSNEVLPDNDDELDLIITGKRKMFKYDNNKKICSDSNYSTDSEDKLVICDEPEVCIEKSNFNALSPTSSITSPIKNITKTLSISESSSLPISESPSLSISESPLLSISESPSLSISAESPSLSLSQSPISTPTSPHNMKQMSMSMTFTTKKQPLILEQIDMMESKKASITNSISDRQKSIKSHSLNTTSSSSSLSISLPNQISPLLLQPVTLNNINTVSTSTNSITPITTTISESINVKPMELPQLISKRETIEEIKRNYNFNLIKTIIDDETIAKYGLPFFDSQWRCVFLQNKFYCVFIRTYNSAVYYEDLRHIAYSSFIKKHIIPIGLKSFDLQDEKLGIYAVPNYKDRVFFGPFALSDVIQMQVVNEKSQLPNNVNFIKVTKNSILKQLNLPVPKTSNTGSSSLTTSALLNYFPDNPSPSKQITATSPVSVSPSFLNGSLNIPKKRGPPKGKYVKKGNKLVKRDEIPNIASDNEDDFKRNLPIEYTYEKSGIFHENLATKTYQENFNDNQNNNFRNNNNNLIQFLPDDIQPLQLVSVKKKAKLLNIVNIEDKNSQNNVTNIPQNMTENVSINSNCKLVVNKLDWKKLKIIPNQKSKTDNKTSMPKFNVIALKNVKVDNTNNNVLNKSQQIQKKEKQIYPKILPSEKKHVKNYQQISEQILESVLEPERKRERQKELERAAEEKKERKCERTGSQFPESFSQLKQTIDQKQSQEQLRLQLENSAIKKWFVLKHHEIGYFEFYEIKQNDEKNYYLENPVTKTELMLFKNVGNIARFLYDLLKTKVHFRPSKLKLNFRLISDISEIRNMKPFDLSTLGYNHVLTTNGLYNITDLSDEMLASIGFKRTVINQREQKSNAIKEKEQCNGKSTPSFLLNQNAPKIIQKKNVVGPLQKNETKLNFRSNHVLNMEKKLISVTSTAVTSTVNTSWSKSDVKFKLIKQPTQRFFINSNVIKSVPPKISRETSNTNNINSRKVTMIVQKNTINHDPIVNKNENK